MDERRGEKERFKKMNTKIEIKKKKDKNPGIPKCLIYFTYIH